MSPTIHLCGGDRLFGAEIALRLGAGGGGGAEGPPTGEPEARVLVVNRPASQADIAFDALDDIAFEAAVDDTLLSVFDIVQAALPSLGPGSAVVIVASRAHLGAWGCAHTAAATAALVGFCRTLSLELSAGGVTVNVVAADFAKAYAEDPQGRARVAEAVAWFASEGARAISGEVMLLNGGRSLEMREARHRQLG